MGKSAKPKQNASRKNSSITARVRSGFHCPTVIIKTRCPYRVSDSEPPPCPLKMSNNFLPEFEPNHLLTAAKRVPKLSQKTGAVLTASYATVECTLQNNAHTSTKTQSKASLHLGKRPPSA